MERGGISPCAARGEGRALLPKKTEPANARDGDNVHCPVRSVQEKESVEFMGASSHHLHLDHRPHGPR
jgi:hypothetical protein